MLWTLFMLFMFAWMLGLVLEFRLGAIPLVIVLATIMAFIKLIRRRSAFLWGSQGATLKAHLRGWAREFIPVIEMSSYKTKEEQCLKSLWPTNLSIFPAGSRHRGLGLEPSANLQDAPSTIFISWLFRVRNAKDPSLPGGRANGKTT
jgi:hypothetical protein